MKDRHKKIDRLIKVQKHLHRSAEIRLASLQRREDELKAAQEEILQTMGDADALHGLFVDVIAKRMRMLALEETRTQAAIIDQKAVATEKALQVKRGEKLFSRLQEEVRRDQEKADLIAVLEAMVGRDGTSLP